MKGHRNKRGASMALTLPTTMPRVLMLLVAFLLALASTGVMPQTAFATGDAEHSSDIEWGQQGRDQADPDCQSGQTATFHFVLAPSGVTLVDAGMIDVTFADGSTDSSSGAIQGNGSAAYDVVGGYDAVASSATVSGATWNGDGTPMLVLSHSSCQGEPDAPPATEVTPAAATSVDKCGTENDTYTVPSTEGVEYLVDGKVVTAGTYPGTGTVTVTAQPASDDYTLKGDTSWTFKFSDEPCEQPPVTGTGHVDVEKSCVGQVGFDLIAYNDVEGSEPIDFVVTNNLTGQVIEGAGLTNVEYGTFKTSNVLLKEGEVYDFTISGPGGYSVRYNGTFRCSDAPPPPPPATEVTPAAATSVDKCGTENDTYTVPSTEGVEYLVDGKVVTAGTYPGTGTVTVTAQPASDDYTLKGDTSWTFKFSDEPCEQPPVYNPVGSLSSECEVADGAKTGYTVVNAVLDNSESNVELTFEVVETIDGVTNYYQLPVAAGKVATPQVLYSSDDGKKVTLTLNALDTQLAQLSFNTEKCDAVTTPPPPPPTKTCPAGTKWVDLNGNGMVDKGECKKPQPPVEPPTDNNPPVQQPPTANQPPAVNTGLNPGFGAHTGWDDNVSTPQGSNTFLGSALGLMLALGLACASFVRRRKTGDVRA